MRSVFRWKQIGWSSRCIGAFWRYRTPGYYRAGRARGGGSVFTEILREKMQRTFEHAERYGWGV